MELSLSSSANASVSLSINLDASSFFDVPEEKQPPTNDVQRTERIRNPPVWNILPQTTNCCWNTKLYTGANWIRGELLCLKPNTQLKHLNDHMPVRQNGLLVKRAYLWVSITEVTASFILKTKQQNE